ncbi:extracellular solute-binding protein [Terrabacter sp. MAHUQ-38]|uniref:extracellular solute-binding protein n=1 Tax=unclassified Terrabacter TaxID=2630222 RepID=UPI00165E2829|nr:extracellular solute-binding protein [Terrabacter sp. MAHUQ-38]MBC9824046.1 extracellular solute-binding protein [Terrabacter sp. MAHUQ-38]
MGYNASLDRRSFLTWSAVGAAAALAGCTTQGATGAGGAGGAGGKGVTVMGVADDFPKDLLKIWNSKHPDLPVKIIAYDETRLNAMLAAGNPPDLVRGLGAQQAGFLASRKIARPLDDYIAKSSAFKVSDLDPVNDVWRWDGTKQGEGQIYGLTKDYSLDMMLWYNSRLFESVGATAPTAERPPTYDDMLDVAKELTSVKGGKVLRYGMWSTAPAVEGIHAMMATTGVPLFAEDLKTVDFSSPEAQKAVLWLANVAKAKVGYTLLDPNPDGWDWPPFSVQREAMAQAGYWFAGAVAGGEGTGKWARLAPAPMLGTKRVSPTTSATGHWIPTKAKNPDGAFALLEWFTAGEPAVARAKSGWGIPIIRSLASHLPTAEPFQKEALETQRAESQYATVLTFSPYATVTALSATVAGLFPQLVKGGMTIGQFADQANDKCNQLLAEGVSRVGG